MQAGDPGGHHAKCPALEMAIAFASAPQDRRIERMPIPIMKFVVVNSMALRSPAVCAACSRPLKQAYLHDLSSSKHYCRIKCYPRRTMVRSFAGSIATMNPYELAIAWPTLTVEVASARRAAERPPPDRRGRQNYRKRTAQGRHARLAAAIPATLLNVASSCSSARPTASSCSHSYPPRSTSCRRSRRIR